jgi:hypothetical protein
MRHIAQQKFVELVNSGAARNATFDYYQHVEISFGSWSVIYDTRGYIILLGNETIWTGHQPKRRVVRETAKGAPDKRDAAKAEKEYQAALAIFEDGPIVVAAKKLFKDAQERECEARRRSMEASIKASCKTLQEAISAYSTPQQPVAPRKLGFASRILRALNLR